MRLKILYFTESSTPTNYDRQRAMYAGQSVAFRNLERIKPSDPAEDCDAVMGVAIPSQYADKPVFGN